MRASSSSSSNRLLAALAAKAKCVDAAIQMHARLLASTPATAATAATAANSNQPATTLNEAVGQPAHTYARLADAPLEGISSLSKDAAVRYSESWHSGVGVTDAVKTAKAAGASLGSLAGLYVDLPGDVRSIKEAQPEFYHHPELTKAKVKQFDYGAKGAVHEFQSTGKHMCMYREGLNDVLQTVLNSEKGKRTDLVVDGWTGSGKSVALYALTAAARASGWVVMYVPSAALFVQGGMFKKKEEEDTMFSTPVAAQHVLRGVYEAHKDALGSLPSADGASSIGDVCARGLETQDPFDKVDAAAGVLEALLMADGKHDGGRRTLVVVDDYNYLYFRTSYHETVHRFHRRRLEPRELKLASAFMMLQDQARTSGVAAVAPTYGGPVSPATDVPLTASATTIVRMPRFSLHEVANMVNMYTNGARDLPDAAVKRALALSKGNGKELREKRATLFQPDNGLELSRGV